MKKIIRIICLICAVLLMTGCSPQEKGNLPASTPEMKGEATDGVRFFFDTVVTIRLYDAQDGLMEDIWKACSRFESLLSKTVEGSDVWRINHAQGEPVKVSEDTWNILHEAKQYNNKSDGAFAVTLAPVISLWDFTGGTERMPSDDERTKALEQVDDAKLILGDDFTVTLPDQMSIDLGGIAKGYIADQIARMVYGRVSGATLNFGGNIYVLGMKPDGTAYRIGIRNPQKEETVSRAIVSVHDLSVVTSGIYERFFIKDGVQYHHILDPKTGISADTDLASATIIDVSSMEADAIATACIVLGSERALEMLNREGYNAVLITRDDQVLTTKDFPYSLELR